MNARNDPPVITGNDVERILEALRDPACYPHPVRRVAVIETHISWVLLTGDYAYKIKKPVNLGFLDFTTLAARRHYCEEELRLNRRLAPDIYLATVAITGDPDEPHIGGSGPVLEYAVKMREYRARADQFAQRHAAGCVRECHGDLHLGNIALLDGKAIPFDYIEFNPALRWMDVASEVAFPTMDLEAHGRRDLAYVFLNAYLEHSGDYGGVAVLPFYFVYRAIVRAKISLLRAAQHGAEKEQGRRARAAYQRYLALAVAYTNPRRGAVIIMHGLSGSGKTTLTQPAVAALGAVRIRSDIERKRLHGVDALARSGSATGGGIYATGATARTYEQLQRHARSVVGAGLPVIIDATFLKREQRAAFRALARELAVPFAIVNVAAPHEALRARALCDGLAQRLRQQPVHG